MEKATVPKCHKICAAGNVGALLLSLTAGAVLAQEFPEFRTGASSAARFSPPMTPMTGQPESVDPFQLLSPGQQPSPSQSPQSAQLPVPLTLPGASPAAQMPPPAAPLSDQSQSMDQLPLLNPAPAPDSPQTPTSPQAPLSSQLPMQLRIQSTGLPANPPGRPVTQRVLEIPAGFERHPTRNLAPVQGSSPFTLRDTSAEDVQAQLSLSLQMDLWHDDDLDNAPRPLAIEGTVAEYTPSLQLNIGSIPASQNEVGDIPGARADLSLEAENYLQLQYLPTIYDRLDAGTSRTLQRILGEAGRANALLTTAVHFEYDENLVLASDSISSEDTYTLLEISPVIAYSPSAKTSLWAQGFYRRITVEDSTSSRNEYVLDSGIDCETSVKTSVGIGAEAGHITFDDPEFATQDYQQGYLVWTWKPTTKITFRTRTGVELREFADQSKPNRASLVTNTVLNWQPDEQTRVNFGIRVQNQPSVTQNGALYQDVRIAADVRHEFGWNLYVRGELSIDHRNYDSGLTQMDIVFRPAVGYHTEVGRLFDSVNIEVYYQRQQSYSNQVNSNFDRNVFGLQSTIYF